MRTVVHYISGGEITQVVVCPSESAHVQRAPVQGGQLTLDGAHPNPRAVLQGCYITNGALASKREMPCAAPKTNFAADGVAEIVISGIPHAAIVRVSGAVTAGPETITDGELVITSITPGEITVSVTKAPEYLDWRIIIRAT
jgi:hypothetical protein